MKIYKMRRLLVLKTILLASTIANVSLAQNVKLEEKLPLDAEVRRGVLDNGLTYYIRNNKEPLERASFYMIQNVGALLENDEQNGLAHFLEHMAFNGTQNFEGKGILNTLEKHGIAFGRNINAYTSMDETVYFMKDVPTSNTDLLDTCLLVLHDWSDYLLLTEEEIDLERGVIMEEWRTRRTASRRMRNLWFPVVFKGSKYAERDVIGDTVVIKYHKPETLRKFYHDWYRTDLQAIAIVGDFDIDRMEAKVKELFSEIKPVENPEKRNNFEVPEHEETYFVVATDKEASQSNVSMFILSKNNDCQEKTFEDLRNGYIRTLHNNMMRSRISELLQKGTPPFILGSISIADFIRGYDAYNISVTANPNEEAKAFEAILTEVERFVRFGFTESELERAKSNFLTGLESQYKQRDKINNETYANQCRGHYLTKSPMPGFSVEYEFATAIVPTITVEDITNESKKWILKENRSIVITGPSEGVTHLTKEEAFAIINSVENRDIEPYKDIDIAKSLVDSELTGSKVIKTTELKDFDAVEWILSNNAKVIYRHADFEKDNVSMEALSFGGTSLWDDSYVPSLELASSFAKNYGVGSFSNVALQKMLAGKKVSMSPVIGGLSEGLKGSSSPKDFETMLQLAYLYFEHPRFDVEAHDALIARNMSMITNLQKDPRKIMSDSLSFILDNYHPRTRILDSSYIESITIENVEKIYRDRIKDAGDFTFFIVGNIDQDTVKNLVEKYIGSLTDDSRTETWVDRGVRMPDGVVKKRIKLPMTTPLANVNICISNDNKFSAWDNLAMRIFKDILRLRYTEKVREEEGGTYGVNVSGSLSKLPVEEARLNIRFDCDPDRTDKLTSIVYGEIDKIIAEGPTEVDFYKTIKNIKKDRAQSREHNSFWMNSLYNYYYYGVNFADSVNYEDILDKMKPSDIQNFAKKFYSDSDTKTTEVTFEPQKEE